MKRLWPTNDTNDDGPKWSIGVHYPAARQVNPDGSVVIHTRPGGGRAAVKAMHTIKLTLQGREVQGLD